MITYYLYACTMYICIPQVYVCMYEYPNPNPNCMNIYNVYRGEEVMHMCVCMNIYRRAFR